MAELARIPNSEEITKITSQLNDYIWTTDNRKNLGLGRDPIFNQYFKIYSDQSASADRRLISLLSMYYHAKGTELNDPTLKAKAAEMFKHQEIKKPVARELEKVRSGLDKSLEGQKQMEKIREAASDITSKDPNIAQAAAVTIRGGFIGLYRNKTTRAEARELLDKLIKDVPEMDTKAAETFLGIARGISDTLISAEKSPIKLEKSEVIEDLKKILDVSYTKGLDNLLNQRLTALYELGRVDPKEAEKEVANIITDDHKKETWKYALTLYKLNAITSPVSAEIMGAFLKKYPELNSLLS